MQTSFKSVNDTWYKFQALVVWHYFGHSPLPSPLPPPQAILRESGMILDVHVNGASKLHQIGGRGGCMNSPSFEKSVQRLLSRSSLNL